MRILLKRTVAVLLVLMLVGAASTSTWTERAEALSLNIALESPVDASVTLTGDVFEKVKSLLTARGHTVSVVSGSELDSPSKIGAFDVVILTGSGFKAEYDWQLFDAHIESYVNGGGGLVNTAWGLSQLVTADTAPYPGIEAVMPFIKGTSFAVLGTITVLPGHPITQGLSDFPNPHYDGYGGGPKVGATVLTRRGVNDDSATWDYGTGRVVYLGAIYLADYVIYNNEALLDGSSLDAQQLFINAVEWAGGGLPATPVPGVTAIGLWTMAGLFVALWAIRMEVTSIGV